MKELKVISLEEKLGYIDESLRRIYDELGLYKFKINEFSTELNDFKNYLKRIDALCMQIIPMSSYVAALGDKLDLKHIKYESINDRNNKKQNKQMNDISKY